MTRKTDVTHMFELLAENLVEDHRDSERLEVFVKKMSFDLRYYYDKYKEITGRGLWTKMSDDELDESGSMNYE
ncbi:MAG: hypothetical protein E3J86_11795 [Candidatus Thorarchaeota archaeon]|nr:MAG: hypothetical protein E3J86_11795 [Candidatus Thorarchaeota archaeon]